MAHMHFIHIYVDSPTTHIQSTWLNPADRQGTGHSTTRYWKDLARTLERGFFDGIFIADIQSIEPEFARQDIAFGSGIPRHDPMMTLPSMADVTRHLGFGVTSSTAGTAPYAAVRRLGTLDNLTGGRVGWNVVTSYQKSDYLALGIDQPDHDLRYDMADEYLEICRRLWDAFPRDAIIADRDKGVFVDIDRIKRVEFAGQFYRCEAYPVIECSPQGRPLIFQAGASGRGIRFAATHADAVFALQPTMQAMKSYLANISKAAADVGRPDPKVYLGIQPYIGGTEAEAQARLDFYRDRIPVDVALNRLGAVLGIDFRGMDIDRPFEELSSDAGSYGLMRGLVDWGSGEAPTIRDAALQMSMSSTMPRLVGTPEQIADRIEAIWRETGCFGFALSPHASPQSAEEFVDHVVPILQKRGLMRTEYAGTTFRENINQP